MRINHYIWLHLSKSQRKQKIESKFIKHDKFLQLRLRDKINCLGNVLNHRTETLVKSRVDLEDPLFFFISSFSKLVAANVLLRP